jgi:hypothetical protein
VSDIVQKVWGFGHTLRPDGLDSGDSIEQITVLLFLEPVTLQVMEQAAATFKVWPILAA